MWTRFKAFPALAALIVACTAGEPETAGPAPARTEPVTVFAAASLRDVANDLASAFERRHGHTARFNFAGSNTLAQQIRAAPRVDVFLSADERWVRFVEEAGLALPGSRRPFLGNGLVAIARRDSTLDPGSASALADTPFRHLALADPAAVPAGRYARDALERADPTLWPALQKRIVPALDARAALALVGSDPDILGIVYRTDAASSDRVRVLFELPPSDDRPIVYWAVGIEGGPNPRGGRSLLEFLADPEALETARRHGFSTVTG